MKKFMLSVITIASLAGFCTVALAGEPGTRPSMTA